MVAIEVQVIYSNWSKMQNKGKEKRKHYQNIPLITSEIIWHYYKVIEQLITFINITIHG